MHTAKLGRIGIWLPLHLPEFESVDRTSRLARQAERLGYGSLWSGEIPHYGREPFAHHAVLLAATHTLITGTGIAHLAARAPATTVRAARTLTDAFPDRFVLGLGGQGTLPDSGPLAQLRTYLDGMDRLDNPDGTDEPVEPPDARSGPPRVLAALGPRMLDLAAERTDGAHTFLAPVEHTSYARERLGARKLLLPTQAVMLTDDRAEVRAALLGFFGGSPARSPRTSYHANLRRFGYLDEEVERMADRLIDALVAWGDENTIAARIGDQLDAGASSVLIHPIPSTAGDVESQLDRLASSLPLLPAP